MKTSAGHTPVSDVERPRPASGVARPRVRVGSGPRSSPGVAAAPWNEQIALEMQRQAGNRAVTQFLWGRPREQSRGAPQLGPVQRRINLLYAVTDWWQPPDILGASATQVAKWLQHADSLQGGESRRADELTSPELVKGAQFLAEVDSITKTYTLSRSGAEPDRLIADLRLWGMLASAPESFRQFLLGVWRDVRNTASSQKAGEIYDLYGGQVPGQPVPTTDEDSAFFGKLKPWFETEFSGWKVWNQSDYFLHVESPDWKLEEAQRFYFNPGPDYKAAMRIFVRLMKDFIAQYGGKGKVGAPSQYGKRSDCIVLWVPKAVAATAEHELGRMDPTTLGATGTSVPVMLREVIPGVGGIGTGEEPLGSSHHSFGSLRAVLLAQALDGARDVEEFLQSAWGAFKAAKIPWEAPDRGGEVKPGSLAARMTTGRTV